MKKFLNIFFLMAMGLSFSGILATPFLDKTPGALFANVSIINSPNKVDATPAKPGGILHSIKNDLNLNAETEQSTSNQQRSFSDQLVKAARIGLLSFVTSSCLSLACSHFLPIENYVEQLPIKEWDCRTLALVQIIPIAEEFLFTYLTTKFMGRYSQVVGPIAFGATHCRNDFSRNQNINFFAQLAARNFIHQQVMRRNPEKEFCVVTLSHLLVNGSMLVYHKLLLSS